MKCCDLHAGMLRHPFELQRLTRTKISGGAGAYEESWQTIATGRCHFKAMSGRDRWESDRTEHTSTARVVMRYREDIKETDRLIIRGQEYRITFIDNLELRNRWLKIDVDGGRAT